MAIQDVVKFYVQTINYNGISEAANSHSSHLVLFRSLQEQGEARNNAICLDKLLMLSSVMLIVPDTCRSQLEATHNLVCFSLMTQSGELFLRKQPHIMTLNSPPFHQEANLYFKVF